MNPKKRRPTSTSKSHRLKGEGASHVTIPEPRPVPPSSNVLLIRKYFFPAIQEEERHQAFLLTRFLKGSASSDPLQLFQAICFYGSGEHLVKIYEKSLMALRWAVTDTLQHKTKPIFQPRYFPNVQTLLKDNSRKKQQLLLQGSASKKQELKSTEVNSKKEIRKILGDGLSDSEGNLNESDELGKLSKCLRRVLKLHSGTTTKGYKNFVSEMQKKSTKKQQSENMKNLILNLQKDFSSIQQEQDPFEYSRESIYGLSDLKRKSDRNQSKLQNKHKEKKSSNNFAFCHLQFKKSPHPPERSGNSTSKNSGKSTSVRKSKQNTSTPDNHRIKSKSKSTNKRPGLKAGNEKKSKLTDTQKLYFDEGTEKIEERQDPKSSLKESTKRGQPHGTAKSKKKGFRP